MSNFSDFFPAAGGGGGGFTKQNKYSTLRSADATYKTSFTTTLNISGDVLIGYTTLNGRPTTTDDRQYFTAEDSYVGMTFTETGQTHTVTASTAHSAGGYATLTFTPALSTGQIANNENIVFNGAPFTVNPATDLGLEDGAPLGYFLVGGGGMSNTKDMGAFGGMIIQGITTIVTAATDIILTPGVGHVVNTVDGSAGYDYNATGAALQSTITGGLSLTTADGHNGSGFGATTLGGYGASAGSGINGYGSGAAPGDLRATSSQYNYGWTGGNNRVAHGFGVGGAGGMTVALGAFEGSDGAIILFY
jgi:hypothetical protein